MMIMMIIIMMIMIDDNIDDEIGITDDPCWVGMVQTRSQFEFCLMAVAEETHAILKALPQ